MLPIDGVALVVEPGLVLGWGALLLVHGAAAALMARLVSGRDRLDALDLGKGWAIWLAVPVGLWVPLMWIGIGFLPGTRWFILLLWAAAAVAAWWRISAAEAGFGWWRSLRLETSAWWLLLLAIIIAGLRLLLRPDLGFLAAPDELGHLVAAGELSGGELRRVGLVPGAGDPRASLYGSDYPRGFHALLLAHPRPVARLDQLLTVLPAVLALPLVLSLGGIVLRWAPHGGAWPAIMLLTGAATWTSTGHLAEWLGMRATFAIPETLATAMALPILAHHLAPHPSGQPSSRPWDLWTLGAVAGLVNPTTLLYWSGIIVATGLIQHGRWVHPRAWRQDAAMQAIGFGVAAVLLWMLWAAVVPDVLGLPEPAYGAVPEEGEADDTIPFWLDILLPTWDDGRAWSLLAATRELGSAALLLLSAAVVLGRSDPATRHRVLALGPPLVAAGALALVGIPAERAVAWRGQIAWAPFVQLANVLVLALAIDAARRRPDLPTVLLVLALPTVWLVSGADLILDLLERPVLEPLLVIVLGGVATGAVLLAQGQPAWWGGRAERFDAALQRWVTPQRLAWSVAVLCVLMWLVEVRFGRTTRLEAIPVEATFCDLNRLGLHRAPELDCPV